MNLKQLTALYRYN